MTDLKLLLWWTVYCLALYLAMNGVLLCWVIVILGFGYMTRTIRT